MSNVTPISSVNDPRIANLINGTPAAGDNRLAAIPGEIETYARRTIEGIWKIGTLLNEAAAILDTDAAYGKWLRENITEPLGIAKRTAARFRNIAARFESVESIPAVGLSVLYDVASLADDSKANAVIDWAHARVESGSAPTTAESSLVVSKLNTGRITPSDLREETALINAPSVEPTVIDNDTGEVVTPPPAPAAPARDYEAEAATAARDFVRSLAKRGTGPRVAGLNALLDELRKKALSKAEDGIGFYVHADGYIVATNTEGT